MATATITSVSYCPGGDHAVLRLTVGAQNFDFTFHVDEIVGLQITNVERRELLRLMAGFHCFGMTKAQTKAELASPGISVVTS